jgi:hypothetical protein
MAKLRGMRLDHQYVMPLTHGPGWTGDVLGVSFFPLDLENMTGKHL